MIDVSKLASMMSKRVEVHGVFNLYVEFPFFKGHGSLLYVKPSYVIHQYN